MDIGRRLSGHKLKYLLAEGFEFRWKNFDVEQFANKEHEEAFYIALFRPRLNMVIDRVKLK